MATAGGGIVAVMLLWLAHMPLGLSLVVGIAVAVVGGLFLSWGFCTGAGLTEPIREAVDVPARGSSAAAPVAEVEVPAAEPTVPDTAAPPSVLPSEPPVSIVVPFKSTGGKGSGKPVARRSEEERGLLGAVKRTHSVGAPQSQVPTLRLAGPRDGLPDDLKLIRGIGPSLEALLNSEGVWHFDQIAGWKARDIAEIDARLGRFRGRITRDEWVRQARILAASRVVAPSPAQDEAKDG